eukprot:613816-Rhodomonas_salina.1
MRARYLDGLVAVLEGGVRYLDGLVVVLEVGVEDDAEGDAHEEEGGGADEGQEYYDGPRVE